MIDFSILLEKKIICIIIGVSLTGISLLIFNLWISDVNGIIANNSQRINFNLYNLNVLKSNQDNTNGLLSEARIIDLINRTSSNNEADKTYLSEAVYNYSLEDLTKVIQIYNLSITMACFYSGPNYCDIQTQVEIVDTVTMALSGDNAAVGKLPDLLNKTVNFLEMKSNDLLYENNKHYQEISNLQSIATFLSIIGLASISLADRFERGDKIKRKTTLESSKESSPVAVNKT